MIQEVESIKALKDTIDKIQEYANKFIDEEVIVRGGLLGYMDEELELGEVLCRIRNVELDSKVFKVEFECPVFKEIKIDYVKMEHLLEEIPDEKIEEVEDDGGLS